MGRDIGEVCEGGFTCFSLGIVGEESQTVAAIVAPLKGVEGGDVVPVLAVDAVGVVTSGVESPDAAEPDVVFQRGVCRLALLIALVGAVI